MQPHVLRVVWRAEAHKRAHHELIGRRLQRFRPEVRHVVRALAACHSRLADLVVSFPALAVALAKPRAHFDPEPVIADVIAGARLVELGQAAGVPLWLRALPPEAFTDAFRFCRIRMRSVVGLQIICRDRPDTPRCG